MKLALGLIAVAFGLLILNGYNHRTDNAALDAKCAQHGGTFRGEWDGATLVAVTCNDERRFTQ